MARRRCRRVRWSCGEDSVSFLILSPLSVHVAAVQVLGLRTRPQKSRCSGRLSWLSLSLPVTRWLLQLQVCGLLQQRQACRVLYYGLAIHLDQAEVAWAAVLDGGCST